MTVVNTAENGPSTRVKASTARGEAKSRPRCVATSNTATTMMISGATQSPPSRQVPRTPGTQDHDTVGQVWEPPAHRVPQVLKIPCGAPSRFRIAVVSFTDLPPW
jgi:hypothetical protein